MELHEASEFLGRAWLHLAQQTDLIHDNDAWDANLQARILLINLRYKVIFETEGNLICTMPS
jgi:hypothetical protein